MKARIPKHREFIINFPDIILGDYAVKLTSIQK